MLVSRDLYKKSSKTQKIRCEICSNYCKIADGSVGVCRQHKNINGELFDESYGIVSSLSPDPVEKKPLNHFLPGTFTYSIGGFGCNMTCLHCQNYMISQEYDKNSRGIKITPEAIVENALRYNCESIAWTYNEPTIHLPFSKKTSLLARSIKRVYDEGKHLEITNLIINDYNDSIEEINELCDFVVNELDCNVPLHFSRAFPY